MAAQQSITVKVGKAITSSFPFAGLEIGMHGGTWQSEGLQLEIADFPGDARLQPSLKAIDPAILNAISEESTS